jgi:hypothetical protein
MLKNKIMKKRKVIFTDNDGFKQVFIYDSINLENNGAFFIKDGNCVLFLPSWCAFATVDFESVIPDFLCLPTKK